MALLATLESLKRYLRTAGVAGAAANLDDVLLTDLLEAASSRFEEACPARTLDVVPAVGGDPVALTFALRPPRRMLQVPDLRELVSVELNGQALDTTGALMRRLHPRELCAVWLKLPLPSYSTLAGGDAELTVTGHWGPAGAKIGTPPDELAVRADVRDAVTVWAARAFHHRTARFADNVQDPAGGMHGFFRTLPADVKLVADSLEVPGL